MYTIKAMPEAATLTLEPDQPFDPKALPEGWRGLEEATIACYPWHTNRYQPESHARVGWNSHGLFVLMYSKEPVIRAEETVIGGSIYQDSCLEWYVQSEKSELYFNFECNPKAVMFFSLGAKRENREIFTAYPQGMTVRHSLHTGGWWAIQYRIPADFLKKASITLAPGERLKGNFYKCGDLSVEKHHGMWNPIDWPKPDFHRPEFFGEMVLEG